MLSMLDILATPIQIKYLNNSFFSTKFSMIISTIILIILIGCFAYFSQYLFKKTNPDVSVVKENLSDLSYTTIIANDGIFMELYTYGINSDDVNQYLSFSANLRDFSKTQKLKLSDCNDFYPKQYDRGFTYCLENKQIELVLNHTSGYNERSLEITISKCSNSTDQGIICKTDEEIDEYIFSNTLALRLTYWEENPYNYKQPLLPISDQLTIDIQHEYENILLFSLDVINIVTDNGLIFSDTEKKSNLYLNKFRTNKLRRLQTDPFAILRFFLNGNVKKVERKYKKLQDIFSELGGIYLILQIIGNNIVRIFNPVFMDLSIINNVFEFKKQKQTNENNPIIQLTVTDNNEKRSMKISPNNIQKVQIFKESELENSKDVLEIEKNKKIKLELTKDEFYNDFVNNQKHIKSNKKLKLSFSDIVYSSICPKNFLSEQTKEKKKCLEKISTFIAEKSDLIRIVRLSRDFKLLKNLIFSENQKILLNFISKPNFDEFEATKNKTSKLNICYAYNYYKENKFSNSSETEKKILENMDPDTIQFFEEKIKNGVVISN